MGPPQSFGGYTQLSDTHVTCGLCWQDRKNNPGFSIGIVFVQLTSCHFCCLEPWHLGEENQPFPAREKRRYSRAAVVAGMKRHPSPWKTGQQNCPLEAPAYLLTAPLTTVRTRCACWLKLRENKYTLHLQSFLRSFKAHCYQEL